MDRVLAGIDTWSPCWYVDSESSAGALLDELAPVKAGRGTLVPEAVRGHRVGWNSAVGLLYAEGHPLEGELCPVSALPDALAALEADLEGYGVPVPKGRAHAGSVLAQTSDRDGFGGLRRCDATVDMSIATRAEGLAILAGVAAMATMVPRSQAEVRYAKDGSASVETVYLRGHDGVKILGRWYDKGLESWGPGRRGLAVRAEDQRRFPKGHRRAVDELTPGYVAAKFKERFYPMWKATKGVTVAGQVVLFERLAERALEGELSAQRARALAGYVALRAHGVEQSVATDRRRRQELREQGLVEAQGAIEDVEVDLHEVLERALDGPTWGAEG